jgi:hypothetical protein
MIGWGMLTSIHRDLVVVVVVVVILVEKEVRNF